MAVEPAGLRACSHVVLATEDVAGITRFFREAFAVAPVYENEQFSEFVLPSKFRVAFFVPVGASARSMGVGHSRGASALGLTVADVDAVHARLDALRTTYGHVLSGPPKDHPWGARSFLLTDPDGNRWEVTQAPSEDGMLSGR